MRRILFAVLSFVLLTLFFPHFAFADENFNTSYDVIYNVGENGNTKVTMRVTLTNKTADSYASSYTVSVGFSDIKNVSATDAEGFLTPVIEKKDGLSSIFIPFKSKVVGLNNSQVFTLNFDTGDIAARQGKIWEINIPGIENQDDFERFNVRLITPASLGKPAYIKPHQATESLTFTKEQLGTGGISVAFGSMQSYEFKLIYHLQNSHVYPIKTEIALPPTTNYQDVFIDKINPKPNNVIEDEDGNYLASYSIPPSGKIDVEVAGRANLYLTPRKQKESEEKLSHYLKDDQYWQKNNKKIKELAENLKTPYAIYQYVVNTLKYDFSRVTDRKSRLGGVSALTNPNSAVCLEFTDLFVTLARAAGIPAREVNGFAYTQDDSQRPLSLVADILHAWPQYYDKELETWIMVDPTWGNTTGGVDYFGTLDFDHFAFVIKGVDSTYPIPAGGYKFGYGENKKDVHVSFSLRENTDKPNIVSSVSFSKNILAGFPINGNILLQNNGPAYFPKNSLLIKSSEIVPAESKIEISGIPPFGYKKVPVSFASTSLLTNTNAKFTIHLGNEELEYEIKIIPFYKTIWFMAGGGILIAAFAITIFVIAKKPWRLFIPGQKQESNLRGQSQEPKRSS